MTDNDLTPAISAFVDGEAIDPDRLAAALEDPDARAALVDFVRMRAAMRAGEPPLPPSLSSLRLPPVARVRFLRWPAVAALLVLVFLAGLIAPRPWTRHLEEPGDAPPPPTRVERFTPGIDWHQSN
jgi:hypothetical protein